MNFYKSLIAMSSVKYLSEHGELISLGTACRWKFSLIYALIYNQLPKCNLEGSSYVKN